ncbi:hypothetical protein [Neptuniibacter sp. QD37_11]|uniref:defense against restriction DarA-related protein n=1 Tax=Neptuniibacter sp. QD37_11 TaxID=3398209 RepID=UPI0039F4AC34
MTNSFCYGLRARPATIGAVPQGFTQILEPNEVNSPCKPEHIRHGAIVYPTPLSESDIKAYELVDLSSLSSFPDEQACERIDGLMVLIATECIANKSDLLKRCFRFGGELLKDSPYFNPCTGLGDLDALRKDLSLEGFDDYGDPLQGLVTQSIN